MAYWLLPCQEDLSHHPWGIWLKHEARISCSLSATCQNFRYAPKLVFAAASFQSRPHFASGKKLRLPTSQHIHGLTAQKAHVATGDDFLYCVLRGDLHFPTDVSRGRPAAWVAKLNFASLTLWPFSQRAPAPGLFSSRRGQVAKNYHENVRGFSPQIRLLSQRTERLIPRTTINYPASGRRREILI